MAVAFQNPCRIVEISKSYVFLTELIIKISIIFIPRKLLYTKLRIPYHRIHHLSLNISPSKKKTLSGKLQKFIRTAGCGYSYRELKSTYPLCAD